MESRPGRSVDAPSQRIHSRKWDHLKAQITAATLRAALHRVDYCGSAVATFRAKAGELTLQAQGDEECTWSRLGVAVLDGCWPVSAAVLRRFVERVAGTAVVDFDFGEKVTLKVGRTKVQLALFSSDVAVDLAEMEGGEPFIVDADFMAQFAWTAVEATTDVTSALSQVALVKRGGASWLVGSDSYAVRMAEVKAPGAFEGTLPPSLVHLIKRFDGFDDLTARVVTAKNGTRAVQVVDDLGWIRRNLRADAYPDVLGFVPKPWRTIAVARAELTEAFAPIAKAFGGETHATFSVANMELAFSMNEEIGDGEGAVAVTGAVDFPRFAMSATAVLAYLVGLHDDTVEIEAGLAQQGPFVTFVCGDRRVGRMSLKLPDHAGLWERAQQTTIAFPESSDEEPEGELGEDEGEYEDDEYEGEEAF